MQEIVYGTVCEEVFEIEIVLLIMRIIEFKYVHILLYLHESIVKFKIIFVVL